jgi:hypothetical protein
MRMCGGSCGGHDAIMCANKASSLNDHMLLCSLYCGRCIAGAAVDGFGAFSSMLQHRGCVCPMERLFPSRGMYYWYEPVPGYASLLIWLDLVFALMLE